jgi:BirA family biotin operon repressor/biotin-[acetyl-CoA-carboxylase] ligase
LFSVVLRPDAKHPDAANLPAGPYGPPVAAGRQGSHLLTITAAVAVALLIRETEDLPARIRWPNDVLINEKKLAGMLVESASQEDRGSFHILGVGLNVNTSDEDFPEKIKKTTTSLAVEKGAPLDRTLLARKILKHLDRLISISSEDAVEEIGQAWRDLSSILGGRVRLLEKGKEFAGRVLDLSPREGIMLELDSGAQRLFRSEEVTLLSSSL